MALKLPPNIDFAALAQMDMERKNPGGKWVNGFYLPPNIDFAGLSQMSGGTPTEAVPQEPGIVVPPGTADGGQLPQVPIKSPEELRQEAAAKARGEIDTNSDFIGGRAALFAQLGSQLTNYDQDESATNTNYEQFKLGNQRNLKDTLVSQANTFADRGTSLGGIAQDASNKANEATNINDLNANTARQQKLASIITGRATARSTYEQQQEELRRKVNESIINRYLSSAGQAFG